MPYIHAGIRASLDQGRSPKNPGELNYKITKLLIEYIQKDPLQYHRINDILGALEGAKLEFYRRVAIPYELYKCAENGDVYGSSDPVA